MKKTIGIIGSTGRMGGVLADVISKSEFAAGTGYGLGQEPPVALSTVFQTNDFVVDFSNASLIAELLKAAIANPKPLVICTTGWSSEDYSDELSQLSATVPVVIATNTSVGAFLQRYLVRKLAGVLAADYDIDIIEKHHRNKIDCPSGTAMTMFNEIKRVKHAIFAADYCTHPLQEGPRPDNYVGMEVVRSGNLPGDHAVSFTSLEEMITVQHVAFDRKLFAKGAVRIVRWLNETEPRPGIYGMAEVLDLQ
ncbi:MAG: 4-hydroxy-tetrahydrodipicolinate reductase [Negativicutes bacterium]|jgi:4-hydroxy-tetrahydrodipicolinate reductase